MAASALTQLSTRRRPFMSSSFPSFNPNDRAFSAHDLEVVQFSTYSLKYSTVAQKSTDVRSILRRGRSQPARALEEHAVASAPSTSGNRHQRSNLLEKCKTSDPKHSKEAIILLQKSMLEKQWNFAFESTELTAAPDGGHKKVEIEIIRSGMSARRRRIKTNSNLDKNSLSSASRGKCPSYARGIENHSYSTGYMNGKISKDLLSHSDVEQLSEKIKVGLYLEEHKLKLKEKLGYEASDEQLASSLRISCAELRSQIFECSLAREKLAMSNIRLVMSIAQNYKNMGVEITDLIQGGLISLLRGIEKFDSSKGIKISTYLYWWIRQGISRTLVENSRTLRLPPYLHERLILVRNAKTKLEEMGIKPSIERIAESLNISRMKVTRAIEAMNKIYSLDREVFPSQNGSAGVTPHDCIADNKVDNNPWHKIDEWSLKVEVNKLLRTTLCKREREIIRLYYGLNKECHTWEDIGRLIGLSRERVRQIGLAALEKLKDAAREQMMEAMFIKA